MNNVAVDKGQKDETCFRHSKMLENIEEAFDTGPVCFVGEWGGGGEQRDWQLAPERAPTSSSSSPQPASHCSTSLLLRERSAFF